RTSPQPWPISPPPTPTGSPRRCSPPTGESSPQAAPPEAPRHRLRLCGLAGALADASATVLTWRSPSPRGDIAAGAGAELAPLVSSEEGGPGGGRANHAWLCAPAGGDRGPRTGGCSGRAGAAEGQGRCP